jgi:hypothetical protein
MADSSETRERASSRMAGNLEISANPRNTAGAGGHKKRSENVIIRKAPHIEAPFFSTTSIFIIKNASEPQDAPLNSISLYFR